MERERELDALFRSLDFFVMRYTNKDLKKECGRLKMHDSSTGVGRFDFQTCQALWKYAVIAWGDGWPAVRVPMESEESEDEAAVDVTPLPKEAIKDLGDGR